MNSCAELRATLRGDEARESSARCQNLLISAAASGCHTASAADGAETSATSRETAELSIEALHANTPVLQ